MSARRIKQPKVAIVTDWLTDFGGAERVVLAMREIWPDAPIYTSLYRPDHVPAFADADVRTSYLQRIPFVKNRHRLAAPLMPAAMESLDLDAYDIVISSTSSGCAKGVITKPSTLHVSYCHNPPRYLWDDSHAYQRLHSFNPIARLLIPGELKKMRLWDRVAADRVDHFVTNSAFVAARIKKYYQRDATVIYPPTDMAALAVDDAKAGSYFLAVGRLIPYKRFDLAIQAANVTGLKLRIIGTGPEEDNLKKLAGPTVQFMGKVSEEQLRRMYAECRALIFPQVEDFGLTAVEVQAAGRPVVAYAAGGALETVVPSRTGILFREQTVAALGDAMLRAAETRWVKKTIQKNAERFDLPHFTKNFHDYVMERWGEMRH